MNIMWSNKIKSLNAKKLNCTESLTSMLGVETFQAGVLEGDDAAGAGRR